jgi:hypothetical protein
VMKKCGAVEVPIVGRLDRGRASVDEIRRRREDALQSLDVTLVDRIERVTEGGRIRTQAARSGLVRAAARNFVA